MIIKAEGIIIRTKDYGEGNKIVTLFSQELGKASVMARGAKKPKSRLSSISQLFTHGLYLFYKGSNYSMGSLSQGEVIQSFRQLRSDLFKTAYAAYFAELVDKIVEDGERSSFLYQLLLNTFKHLEEDKDPEILARLFEIKLLTVGGYRPEVEQCVTCGQMESEFGFSVQEGGLLCVNCRTQDPKRLNLHPSTYKLLRLLYRFDVTRLGNINVKQQTKDELRQALWLFMDHHTPLRLKSRSFLEQMGQYFKE